MSNNYFQFKQFTVYQDKCAMKVTTEGCLFGSLVPALIPTDENHKVLDIGTGTGLLSLMYAQQKQHAEIDAIEWDREAASQASENARKSPWPSRIQILQGDARDHIYPQQYDVILSNPPFYKNDLVSPNERTNAALHGSHLQLEELFQLIKKQLSPEGIFFLLLPYKRDSEVQTLAKKNALVISSKTGIRQTTDHDYFRNIYSGKHETDHTLQTTINEISIRDSNKNYTPEFTTLLKNYYLNL